MKNISKLGWRPLVVFAVAAVAVLTPTAAFGAGTGYGPPPPPIPVPGTFGTVMCTQTVSATGGTVTCTVQGATITVTVPSNSFTSPIQIVITAGNCPQIGNAGVPNYNCFLAFGVIVEQNGQKYTGTINPPANVTVALSSINTTDKVVGLNTSNSTYGPISGVSISNGNLSFSISSDPYIAVLAPVAASSTTSTVPGATTVTTGKPFLLEGSLAGLLLLVGISLLVWSTRRSSAAR
ncbi:MAG: hypothetical protein ACYDEP_06465 [Acidimicrobiales bacterium]|jgi:hypothetical protein